MLNLSEIKKDDIEISQEFIHLLNIIQLKRSDKDDKLSIQHQLISGLSERPTK